VARSWSDSCWSGPDAEPSKGPDQRAAGAAAKGRAPTAAPAPFGAAPRSPSPFAAPDAGAGEPDARGGGGPADAEADPAAQNARLRSKRGAAPNCCLYVGFLGWWVAAAELEAAFAQYGRLVSVRVSAGARAGRGWGWGGETADRPWALGGAPPAAAQGKRPRPSRAPAPQTPPPPAPPRPPPPPFPQLLISKKSRRSREQAFVEFASVAAASAAISALDGADLPGLVKQPGCGGLVVRFADSKKDCEA
jgi:hypothetical protein